MIKAILLEIDRQWGSGCNAYVESLSEEEATQFVTSGDHRLKTLVFYSIMDQIS